MAIRPDDLVFTAVHRASGRLGRIAIDGRFAVAVGEGCVATTDGKHLHRRASPGEAYGLAVIDGAL